MKNRNVWMRSGLRSLLFALTAFVFCTVCHTPAMALAYESAVYGDRNIVSVDEGQRSFRLNYRVWSDEQVSRAVSPCDVIFLLDVSSGMDCLAEAPNTQGRLWPNTPYKDKVGEKTVLYTLSGGDYVPVTLQNNVWKTNSGDRVGTRKLGTDVFTADVYEKSGCATRMERMREAVRGFLQELSDTAPDSHAGLVFFGKDVASVEPEQLDLAGTARLMAEVSVSTTQSGAERAYATALEQAEKMAGKLDGSQPLYLVSIASGACSEEDDVTTDSVRKSQTMLQKLRESGARTYSILLSGSPETGTEEFWQSMSSVPLDTHYRLCPTGETEDCLAQVRRSIASAFTVSVVENLDPRFDIPQEEQVRLRREGAQLTANRDGSWSVSWEADLPRKADSPWTAGVTVRAKSEFPGGNHIPVDQEGSGLYKSGKLVSDFPSASANVPVKLAMTDLESTIFFGEKVKTLADGAGIEEAMLADRNPNWYGKGQTGSFSYLWETEDGSPVGSLNQLSELRPAEDTVYRFRVSYRPFERGLSSAGTPVQDLEVSALYSVKVVSGSIRIKATAESGMLRSDSTMLFRLEKENGEIFYQTASAEADPQSGALSLEVEVTGLPYGTYTVLPEDATGLSCQESSQICRLGVWEKDDTVDSGRSMSEARFTLRKASTVPAGWPEAAVTLDAAHLLLQKEGDAQ